jgi:hypothetical protein
LKDVRARGNVSVRMSMDVGPRDVGNETSSKGVRISASLLPLLTVFSVAMSS